ncbi:MazG nucleotide pyrophosphohydrolase domain-containing protein [Aliidiomarina quisquiliarum]|uniref:MazG nucleotide pyrophosphohydrolase domain-containing protein n=1 Tax=Aliidiomarina quisquiliarum TaxID=2938947 RepID=UPI00208E7E8F|nr:MazG nucleotide pyrophosphohydrolase domain-containing protein [Aliidiomarina quisquiliarum]MCO4320587.1 hypothetical protein [Aliidiomarina quisquiliarum]
MTNQVMHGQSLFKTPLDSTTPMQQALEIQQRAALVGFDWPTVAPVLDKVREELDEIYQELTAQQVNPARVQEEVGDLLFAVLNLVRHVQVQPEQALQLANEKFMQRFQAVEAAVQTGKGNFNDYSLEELEAFWQQAKQNR